METVRYQFPEGDDDATLEGKFEAIVAVVCAGANKSDVIPGADSYVATVAYAEGERARLEPTVLAIVNNADDTFWEILKTTQTGIAK